MLRKICQKIVLSVMVAGFVVFTLGLVASAFAGWDGSMVGVTGDSFYTLSMASLLIDFVLFLIAVAFDLI